MVLMTERPTDIGITPDFQHIADRIENLTGRQNDVLELLQLKNILCTIGAKSRYELLAPIDDFSFSTQSNLLSDTEKTILSMLLKGDTRYDSADLLRISPLTIAAHRSNILNKVRDILLQTGMTEEEVVYLCPGELYRITYSMTEDLKTK